MRHLTITKSITNRESATFNRYLSDIAKVPLLTIEEEIELARRIKAGDEEALKKLVVSNLLFVVSTAKTYQNQGLELQDLVNEGNLGLIEAAKRYDETKGFKFITYAVNWIRQSIQQALSRNSRTVRLPANQVLTLSKVKKTAARLEQELNREPTLDEISEAADVPVDKVSHLLQISSHFQSLDAPITDDGDTSLGEVFVWDTNPYDTDKHMEREALKVEIRERMKLLPDNERSVLSLMFGLNGNPEHTTAEVCDVMGISRERVRQLKERGLKRLLQNESATNMIGYL